jgi:hypothetical protein
MKSLTNAEPNTLIILSAIISLIITDNKDVDDLESIGNFLTAIADLILLKAGQLAHQEDKKDKQLKITDLENQLNKLSKSNQLEISDLENQLSKLKQQCT